MLPKGSCHSEIAMLYNIIAYLQKGLADESKPFGIKPETQQAFQFLLDTFPLITRSYFSSETISASGTLNNRGRKEILDFLQSCENALNIIINGNEMKSERF